MKTLVINGSLRKDGQCQRLTEIFCNDIDAKTINIFDLNIMPCIDCEECKGVNKCCLHDPMSDLYEDIKDADFIVFTSPVYYSSLTGVMLNFLSRFQMFYLNNTEMKKKRGLLLLTGGGATKRLDLPLHQLRLAARIINCEISESLSFMKTDEMRVEDDAEFLKSLKNIKIKYGLLA